MEPESNWHERFKSSPMYGDVKVAAVICAVCWLLIFAFFRPYYWLLLAVIFACVLYVYSMHRSRHANQWAMERPGMKQLETLGFVNEMYPDYWAAETSYWGYVGLYQNYPMRLTCDCFDDMTYTYFTIYYARIEDYVAVDKLAAKYNAKSRLLIDNYEYRTTNINMVRREVITSWSFENIKGHMDILVEIMHEEKLAPAQIEDIPSPPWGSEWA